MTTPLDAMSGSPSAAGRYRRQYHAMTEVYPQLEDWLPDLDDGPTAPYSRYPQPTPSGLPNETMHTMPILRRPSDTTPQHRALEPSPQRGARQSYSTYPRLTPYELSALYEPPETAARLQQPSDLAPRYRPLYSASKSPDTQRASPLPDPVQIRSTTSMYAPPQPQPGGYAAAPPASDPNPGPKFDWSGAEAASTLSDDLVNDTHFGMVSMVSILGRSLWGSWRSEGKPEKHVHWRPGLLIICVLMPIVQITLIATFGISAIRQGINGPELGKEDSGVYMFFDSSKPFCSRAVNETMQEWLVKNGATANSSGSESLFFVALSFALWTYIARSWFASFYLFMSIQKPSEDPAGSVADDTKMDDICSDPTTTLDKSGEASVLPEERLDDFQPVIQVYFLFPIPAILDRVLHLCLLSFTLGVTAVSMYLVNRVGLMVVNAFALLCIEELDDGLKAWFFNADREKLFADTVRRLAVEKMGREENEGAASEQRWIRNGRRVFLGLLILASTFLCLITAVLIYFLFLTGMGCKPGSVNSISLYG